MQLAFAPFSYGRPGYGLSEARTINCIWEPQPGTASKSALIGRAGLSESYEVGAGPITGSFAADGVFGGDRFVCSGTQVYRETTLLGTVPLGSVARFAASATQLVVVSGGQAWVYNGTTFVQVSIPDGRSVIDVFVLGTRFVYICQDSDRFYWSALGDATTIGGSNFAAASSSPDYLRGAVVLGDEVAMIGRERVEFWYLTTSADAPYARAPGRTYSRGCAAQASIVQYDNGFTFLGEDRIVYRSGAVPSRISTHDIEARLRACTSIDDVTAFSVSIDGHLLYVINIPDQSSWAYDASTQRWVEWRSYGKDNFRGRSAMVKNGVPYIGDTLSGRVWTFDPTVYQDDAGPLERVASCKLAVNGPVRCNSLELLCSKGTGLVDGTESIVEMRYSDNEGRSWSDWASRSTGELGEYNLRVRWNGLGLMKAPGRIFEFRTTSPTLSAFTAVLLNER